MEKEREKETRRRADKITFCCDFGAGTTYMTNEGSHPRIGGEGRKEGKAFILIDVGAIISSSENLYGHVCCFVWKAGRGINADKCPVVAVLTAGNTLGLKCLFGRWSLHRRRKGASSLFAPLSQQFEAFLICEVEFYDSYFF